MRQPTFRDLEYAGKKRKTRREIFLERMDGLIPWVMLKELIRPYYPKAGGGRRPSRASACIQEKGFYVSYNSHRLLYVIRITLFRGYLAMPRFHHSLLENNDSGKVIIKRHSDDHVIVLYTPSKQRLELSDLEIVRGEEPRVRLLCIDGRNQNVTVFPTNTFPRSSKPNSFLKPKYSQVKSITIADWRDFDSDVGQAILGPEMLEATDEDPVLDDEIQVMMVLESLPPWFIKDYDYGLGLTRAYRFIVYAVEDLGIP